MYLQWSSYFTGAEFKVGVPVPPEAGGCDTTVASSGSDKKSAATLILFFFGNLFLLSKSFNNIFLTQASPLHGRLAAALVSGRDLLTGWQAGTLTTAQ